jgi:hypothetical protein
VLAAILGLKDGDSTEAAAVLQLASALRTSSALVADFLD